MTEPAVATDGRVTVTGTESRETADSTVDLLSLCELALTVLTEEGVTSGQLDLHLVDTEAMTSLNEEHMGQSGPTDVLSFPMDATDLLEVGEVPWGGPESEPMLGDVVLCPPVAAAQAADHVGSTEGEFQLLVIHGVLHVLGHDHAEPDETSLMRSRERVHLERLGVKHPEPA